MVATNSVSGPFLGPGGGLRLRLSRNSLFSLTFPVCTYKYKDLPGGKTAPTEMEVDGMGGERSQLYRIQMGVWAFALHKLVAVYILRKKKKETTLRTIEL